MMIHLSSIIKLHFHYSIEKGKGIHFEATTASSIPTIEPSDDSSAGISSTGLNQIRYESESYFNKMFLYIEKAMNYALKNDDSSPLQTQDSNKNTKVPIDEFEELKSEMIKETLCLLFKEKGYPKLPQCDTHVILPSQIRKDVLSRLSNSLKGMSLLNTLENPTKLINYTSEKTEEITQRNYLLTK